ncbi:MAG: biotin--[acetyl-CoA-carboxylase] ligase [Maioricimonas sp. JB049]
MIDADRLISTTFVHHVQLHEELASTNDHAMRHSGTLAPATLIVARRQTAGRGRGTNRWWSSDGALTFSLLIDPVDWNLPTPRWPELSVTVGTAIATALGPLTDFADVRLKWPNDVYLAGRKVCGILVEVASTNPGRLVVGIGLNVNNSFADAPDDVRQRAISLCDHEQRQFDMTDLLERLLVQIDGDMTALAGQPADLQSRWRNLCLLSGRFVTINDGRRRIEGTCLGIDDDAALLVQTALGPQRIYSGVVEVFDGV